MGGQIGPLRLAIGRKQPLFLQPRLALCNLRQQRANAGNLQPLHHDLIFGAAGVGGELAKGDDLQAIFRAKLQRAGQAFPHHRIDSGVGILQGEIQMARRMAFEAGDFAAHPHQAKGRLDASLQRLRKLGNRKLRSVWSRCHAARDSPPGAARQGALSLGCMAI